MSKLTASLRAVLFLFLASLLGGCFPLSRSGLEEEKDPHYLEGMKRVETMDYEGAISSFRRALQTNPDNSAAHFQLGVLYDERKNDNASAIYHLQRFLELKPESSLADVIRQRIIGCTRELARSVALVVAPGDIQKEMARLSKANTELQEQITKLLERIAEQQRLLSNVSPAQPSVPSVPQDLVQPAERPPERVEQPPVHVAETPLPLPISGGSSAPAQANSEGGWVPTHVTPPTRRDLPPPTRSTRVAYKLRKGDTIAALARRYGVSVEEIVKANPGLRPNHVLAGQTVYIPR